MLYSHTQHLQRGHAVARMQGDQDKCIDKKPYILAAKTLLCALGMLVEHGDGSHVVASSGQREHPETLKTAMFPIQRPCDTDSVRSHHVALHVVYLRGLAL